MSQTLTAEDVRKHNHKKSVWMVIKNEVYDVTSFLSEHPGGEDPLLDAAGMDATRAFEDVGHSEDARALLVKYKIGKLAAGESCSSSYRPPRMSDEKSSRHKPRLSPNLSKASSVKSNSSKSSKKPPYPSKKCVNPPPNPRIIPRVSSIVVPRESGSSKWKWAVLALAVAIVAGVAYKKYAS